MCRKHNVFLAQCHCQANLKPACIIFNPQLRTLRLQHAYSFHHQAQPVLHKKICHQLISVHLRNVQAHSLTGQCSSNLKSTVFICAGFHFKSAGHVPGAYGTMTCGGTFLNLTVAQNAATLIFQTYVQICQGATRDTIGSRKDTLPADCSAKKSVVQTN